MTLPLFHSFTFIHLFVHSLGQFIPRSTVINATNQRGKVSPMTQIRMEKPYFFPS